IPYIGLGDGKEYISKYTEINIAKKQLETVNLRGIELYPVNRVSDFINANRANYNELEKFDDKNFFRSYKLSADDEFIGSLNITYDPENVCKNVDSDLVLGACKLISIIIRGWILNKEIMIENKKRIIMENELDDYLDKSIDLFSIYNVKGKLLKISSSWTKVLGWSKEDLLNRDIYKNIHVEDRKVIKHLNEYLHNSKKRKANAKARYLCKDGTYKWIYWNIEYSQKSNAYIVTGKDITYEVNEEKMKKNLEERVKLEAMKNDFFTNLSHEFKTPLNIILGTMQVMQQRIDNNIAISNDDLVRYLKSIRQNSYRVLKLVNNLMDINKMDIGYYDIHLSNNNIVNIIEDICLSVAEYARNKNIELIFDTDCEEVIMACDPEAIERVMLNLLSNAIKYTTDGNGKILINIRDDKEFIFVSVKDNGKGIPKDKLEVIFDRFGQANTNYKQKCEGSGIGLYLVQSIIKLHGGSINVESEEYEGSMFTFSMPKNLKADDEKKNISIIREKNNFNIEKCKIEFSDIYN
ncbi:PAS domain-containing sensor histidine kinase, partial [Terrisporobacter muris]